MKTQVAIIGGGLLGCATAYYLAKQGVQVVVLEKGAGVGLEASGRAAGSVRQQGRKAALSLAMQSVRLWTSLAEELQCDLEYVRNGNLKIAWDEATAADLESEIAWEHEQGLMESRMLTPAECREMIPGLVDRAGAGKYCPSDGTANPMLVTPAFARAAQRLGVEIKTRTTVTGLLRQGSAIKGVLTEAGAIEASVVVNTAGPWACRFNELLGCPTPITPGLSQLMITERLPRRFVPNVAFAGKNVYTVQTKTGNLVVGISGKPNKYGFGRGVEFEDVTTKAAWIGEILPWLRQIAIIRTLSGITEFTPDGEPYIGAVPGPAGLYTAAGFHGQGFCVGPLVGKILSEMITGQEPRVFLNAFRPDRFVGVRW